LFWVKKAGKLFFLFRGQFESNFFSPLLLCFLCVFLQQVVYGFIHIGKLAVVFAFEFFEFRSQVFVRERVLSHKNKCTHDAMFTCTAFLLFKTLESIATPCSVNAKGAYLLPPLFEVAICVLKDEPMFEVLKLNLKVSHSSLESSNIKSSEKLPRLRLTDSFSRLVSVP
jgi:hypothetical protein